MQYIPLEKPIAELEDKILELKRLASAQAINLDHEIEKLETRCHNVRDELFSNLSPYQTAQIARHPGRPRFQDLMREICSFFVELHGDRNFFDDPAIVGGLGTIGKQSCVLIGHQKGKGTKDNIYRNFGMPKPEGYRKALRIMSMAERFNLPIITFVDTPGAYPGIGAEQRGQAEAIAKNIMVMSKLKVPIITVIVGEGGSGGALALAVANRVLMLENSIYSVISPEGCASILMKDASKAPMAADALKLTAQNAKANKIIDTIIKEPLGGAHRNIEKTAASLKRHILKAIKELSEMSGKELMNHRVDKFNEMGKVVQ